ncbi:MAG: HD domain-containing protein [Candidatus Paceibacterota bacterium]
MRSISDIYEEYKIMPSLQMHMLRVAGVASVICDSINEPVNKEDIIIACLLHDMGNIIKSDLKIFPEFVEPEGLEYWQGVKNEYIEKYGDKGQEHRATLAIVKELGLKDQVVSLIDRVRFSLLCEHVQANDVNMKVVHYADTRVGPYGVLSYEERLREANIRYQYNDEERRLVKCGKEIEKQIFAKCKIKPEDINDKNVVTIVSELKNYIVR